MTLLVRAIVMGFGLAAGGALYKRVAKELGLEGDKKKEQTDQEVPPVEPPAGALRQDH